MKTKHAHEYKAKRPNPTVLVCDCGRFQNVVTKENPAIVGIEKPQPTPGPWRVIDRGIISEKLNDFGNFIVTEMPDRGIPRTTPQDQANARLIACAPSLLRMAKLLVQLDDECKARPTVQDGLLSDVREDLDLLIAKAEGK